MREPSRARNQDLNSDQPQDPEDLLSSVADPGASASSSEASTGQQVQPVKTVPPVTWESDDDDWAPPAEASAFDEIASLPSLMNNQPAIEEPVSRNLLPPEEPIALEPTPPSQVGSRTPSRTGKKKMQIIPPVGSTGEPAELEAVDEPEISNIEPSRQRSAAKRGAEVFVHVQVRAPMPGAAAPAARASAMFIPVGVLLLGTGVAGFLSLGVGNHIMGGIALGLSIVGALLTRVFLRG